VPVEFVVVASRGFAAWFGVPVEFVLVVFPGFAAWFGVPVEFVEASRGFAACRVGALPGFAACRVCTSGLFAGFKSAGLRCACCAGAFGTARCCW